jgi:tRNA (cytidine32/uridine32-2'-O)-methyltransferase
MPKCERLNSLLIIGIIMSCARFSNLNVVLNETSHPGNIGAAARALKTMDMYNLTLVKPKQFPDSVAYARSSGATDVLDNATVTQDLNSALAQSQLIIATSARSRQISLPTHTPKEAALLINNALASGINVAVLFGNEQHGLANEELLKCQYQIIIPTSDIYSSLNLATAVQIICYEIFCHSSQKETKTKITNIANSHQIELLFEHTISTLSKLEYLEDKRSSKIAQKIKVMLQQYQFSADQVQILRGILTQINKKITRHEHE